MANAKAWKCGTPGSPNYPADFEILNKAVLQVTDIKTNRNKYYAIELHQASASAAHLRFRVFTHYGRTDDLEKNPNAGVREGRFFGNLAQAQSCYQRIYKQKTSPRKGYKEISLASSRIGSAKARGTSTGHVDNKTLERLKPQNNASGVRRRPVRRRAALSPELQTLMRTLYNEATSALTSTIQARITANGIETPLGVLTIGQIEQGERILEDAWEVFQKSQNQGRRRRVGLEDKLVDLTGHFYTVIPHRIGRSRAAAEASVINTLADFEQKQNTLQLMKDMLKVEGSSVGVLHSNEMDLKYQALGAKITPIERRSNEFRRIRDMVEKSQIKRRNVKVRNVFQVERPGEHSRFDQRVGNEKLLMHGSRIQNWVGILSRGLLMPKIVVSMGVNRTDAGWLGHGLYFGDASCTASGYTSPASNGSRFMTVARVALGRPKQYHKITYGLTAPPAGYDSCHGVRSTGRRSSQFADDEYVVYRNEQQRLDYLVEFTA